MTRRVLAALRSKKAEPRAAEPATAPLQAEPPQPAAPQAVASPEVATRIEPVRRVTPLRIRSGSILGLDISRLEPPAPPSDSE